MTELKLPKLAQVSTVIWPFLILGGAVAAGLAIPANLGWTVGGVVGGRRRRRRDDRRLARPLRRWRSPRSCATPSRSASSSRDAEQEVEQNKDWIKNEFEVKLKEFEERRATKVREAEEAMARIVAEAEQRRQEQHQAADVKFPPLVEQVRVRRDEQMKKVEEIYPAKIAARKEKYDADKKELDESYRADQGGHRPGIRPRLAGPDRRLDRRHGADRRGPARRQRGGRAAVPRLDAARARRLEAADGGPARPAVRRLRGRPEPVSQRRPPRPAAQVGAHPLRPARAPAVPHHGLHAHPRRRRRQGPAPSPCSRP